MRIIRIYDLLRRLLPTALCGLLVSVPAAAGDTPAGARDPNATVPQTWQMLDYMAVDYAGAVNEGAVISQSEYAEEREFAATARAPAIPAADGRHAGAAGPG